MIRCFQEEDLIFVLAIFRAYASEIQRPGLVTNWAAFRPWTYPQHRMLLDFHEGHCVGFIEAFFKEGAVVMVSNMYVRPQYRHRAARLMKVGLRLARAYGCTTLQILALRGLAQPWLDHGFTMDTVLLTREV